MIRMSDVVKRQNLNTEIMSIDGKKYEFWSDPTGRGKKRGTFAKDLSTGITKQLSFTGFIIGEPNVRKAIIQAFGLS